MTESERLDQALTVIDANKWRYRAEMAEAAAMALQAERDYLHLALEAVPVDAIRKFRSWDQGWMEQANCIAAIDQWLTTLPEVQP